MGQTAALRSPVWIINSSHFKVWFAVSQLSSFAQIYIGLPFTTMRWPFSRKYPACRFDQVDSHEFDYIIVGGMLVVSFSIAISQS
jgi:hypothetical protein